MSATKAEALKHLDTILTEYNNGKESLRRLGGLVETEQLAYFANRFLFALNRWAPADSQYVRAARDTMIVSVSELDRLVAAVRGLREEYANDNLMTFREMVTAELNSDYLELGEYLLNDEQIFLPAAVVIGTVLEEWLRNLCTKNGVDITVQGKNKMEPKKADTMNNDLKAAGVYGKNEQKQITAWLGIRNSAAHGKPSEFTAEQVELMLSGVRQMLTAYPA